MFRVASATHAGSYLKERLFCDIPYSLNSFSGGQLRLNQFFFDGAIICDTAAGEQRLHLYNFHSSYMHGCAVDCTNPYPERNSFKERTCITDAKIDSMVKELEVTLGLLRIFYETDRDCPDHGFIRRNCAQDDFPKHVRMESYAAMTQKIFSGEYEGFVVFQNLEIQKKAQSSHMGFCIQKTG